MPTTSPRPTSQYNPANTSFSLKGQWWAMPTLPIHFLKALELRVAFSAAPAALAIG